MPQDIGDIQLEAGVTGRFVSDQVIDFHGDTKRNPHKVRATARGTYVPGPVEPPPPPPPPPPPDPIPDPPSFPYPTLQAAINAGAFLIPEGKVFYETVTLPAGKTLVGAGTGSAIDGQNQRQYGVLAPGDGSGLTNFEVRNHVTPDQRGAVDVAGQRFTGRAIRSHNNRDSGISIGKPNGPFTGGHVLEDLILYDNGRQGIHGTHIAGNGTPGSGIQIRRLHSRHNNGDLAAGEGFESGGGKLAYTSDAIYEDSEVDHNGGPGIWFDIECHRNLVRRNLVHHNSAAGIFYEISDTAVIEYNVVWENGWLHPDWAYGAGIQISGNRDSIARFNTVAWCARGIVTINQHRPEAKYNDVYSGNRIEDNVIVHSTGQKVAGFFRSDAQMGSASGPYGPNGGARNRYWVAAGEPSGDRFEFDGQTFTTLAAYNASPGDEGGRYLSTSERDALLTAAGVPLGRTP